MARVVAASQPSRMARHDRAEVLAARLDRQLRRAVRPRGAGTAFKQRKRHLLLGFRRDGITSERSTSSACAGIFFGLAPRATISPSMPAWAACRPRSRPMSGDDPGAEGVLIAHSDATSGYSLYIKDGHLVHDLNIGGGHEIVRSQRRLPSGAHRLVVYVERPVRKPTACQRRAHGGERIHAADRRRTCGCAQD